MGACSESARPNRDLALGQPFDPGHPADRRDRGAAVGDAEVGQGRAGLEDGVDIHHRLPHPHEDDVVDRFDAAEVERLVEDLVGAEVAAELHLAGGAEGAGQRASRLGGEADRAAAVAVAHQHRLERPAVGGCEEGLHGPVVGFGLSLEGDGRERDLGGEPLAQLRGQVGHLRVVARSARHPLPDLGGAVVRLAGVRQNALQQFAIHAQSLTIRKTTRAILLLTLLGALALPSLAQRGPGLRSRQMPDGGHQARRQLHAGDPRQRDRPLLRRAGRVHLERRSPVRRRLRTRRVRLQRDRRPRSRAHLSGAGGLHI